MQDKKLATESLEEKMKRTGVVNFETNETVSYHEVKDDDNVMGFMSQSFYNKMVADIELNAKAKAEMEMMEQFKAMLNEVLDARESSKRQEEIKLAELRVRELELQVELAKLQSMVPVTHGKLEEVIDEHSAAVEKITEAIVITEKPVKKQRKATVKKSIEGKAPVIGEDYYPLNKGRSGYSIAWKKVIEANQLNTVVYGVIKFALENGVDVRDTNAFRKFHPVCQGAYIQYTKANPGHKGVWKALMEEFGL
jgi:beta-glucosidase-like glycosyl hydrolase